jgi:FkbM family methyltransferase
MSRFEDLPRVTIKLDDGRSVQLAYRQNTDDRVMIGHVWEEREYDLTKLKRWKDIQSIYQSIIQIGNKPLIIDAGGNIGSSAAFFRTTYQDSNIFVIEPEQNNFDLLSYNLQGFQGIQPLRGALTAESGRVFVYDTGGGNCAFRTTRDLETAKAETRGPTQEIRAYSVPELVAAAGRNCEPFILKIDIEGGEEDLFSKNVEWVNDFPVIIIELHDWLLPYKRTAKNFLNVIAGLDRDFVYMNYNVYSVRN